MLHYYGEQFDVQKCTFNYNNRDPVVFIKGYVVDIDKKDNYTSMIITDNNSEEFIETRYYGDIEIFKRAFLLIKGEPVYYKNNKEHYINIDSVLVYTPQQKPLPRPELHARTSYTRKNALGKIDEIIEYCDLINVTDIAFIDMFSVQNIPEVYNKLKDTNRKPIFGVELTVVPDRAGILNDYYDNDKMYKEDIYDKEFVVFDLETTNLTVRNGEIIEIGAVRVKNGNITDSYHSLIKPEKSIPKEITELTGITDEDVKDARSENIVLEEFLNFIGEDTIFVAHNAEFDYNFLKRRVQDLLLKDMNRIYIDTLSFLRKNITMKSYSLDKVVKKFKIESFDHHRADEDAKVTAQVFLKILEIMNNELNIKTFGDLYKNDFDSIKQFGYNVVLLVKNQTGLTLLFELISFAHTKTFYKIPKITENKLLSMLGSKDLLLISPSNQNSEIYNKYIKGINFDEMKPTLMKYDYIEITSPDAFEIYKNNMTKKQIQEMFLDLYNEMKGLDRQDRMYYVSNSFYISKSDKTFYKALVNFDERKYEGENYIRPSEIAYLDMMKIFEDDVIAYDLVYTIPKKLVEYKIENVKPLSGELHQPTIENDKEKLLDIVETGYKNKYLNIDDEILKSRMKKELDSIIGNSFQVLYLMAYDIVKKSLEDGYTVGSRGSVGSSFVAFLMDISEVNPMKPHYFCDNCGKIEWMDNYDNGFDLPDKTCSCGNLMRKDGHKIPFETFLGFEGDKVPDIDLNFSGEYQEQAHKYVTKLFGEDHVFKAGTISRISDKKKFAVAKKYDENASFSKILAIANNVEGSTETSGQHPGGLMIVPQEYDIHDFTPIQYPANNKKKAFTTHFDYHVIHDDLVKLDALGHDTPTIVKYLQDFSGVDPTKVDLSDKKPMEMFQNVSCFNINSEDALTDIGTAGIPEYNTMFMRQMLKETQVSKFADLIRLNGLSHGSGIWIGNMRDMFLSGKASLKDMIAARDDIMNYLIDKGMDKKESFFIMEKVRKGKGLTSKEETDMKKYGVPDWYIESCKKITYMFPKSHAVSYSMMSYRIAWFKYYEPLAFYAAIFSIKSGEFKHEMLSYTNDDIRKIIKEFQTVRKLDPKDKKLMQVLELYLEFRLRGFKMKDIDVNRSDAFKFIPIKDENSLLVPFSKLSGLGDKTAKQIIKHRDKQGKFDNIQQLKKAGINKTVLSVMEERGIISDLKKEDEQLINKLF